MKSVVILLLLLCALACARHSVHLIIESKEFVTIHVGYPGQDVVFRIRWDLDTIAIFQATDIVSRSKSYHYADGTDVFSLGSHGVRLPFDITATEVPGDPLTLRFIQLDAQGHDGTLGLGPGSPIRYVFPWIRYSDVDLELYHHLPVPRTSPILPLPLPDKYYAAKFEHEQVMVQARLDQDVSFFPVSLSITGKWALQFFSAQDATYKSVVKLALSDTILHVHNTMNDEIPIIRSVYDVALPAAVEALTEWNGTKTIVLGRAILQDYFAATVSPNGSVIVLEAMAAHRPLISDIDYIIYLPLAGLLLALWSLAMYEEVVEAEHVAHTSLGHHGKLILPLAPGLENPERPNSLLSFKKKAFVDAAAFATSVTAVTFALLTTMGFGFDFAFHRTELLPYDRAAIYSTVGVMLFLCSFAYAVPAHPVLGCAYTSSGIIYLVWIALMLRPVGSAHRTLLFFTSAGATAFLAYAWMRVITGTMWPHLHYKGAVRLLWSLIATVVLAWAIWQFAFYTVPYGVGTFRPAHPGIYGVGIICCALVFVVTIDFYSAHGLTNYVYKTFRLRRIILEAYKRVADTHEPKKTQ